MKKSILIGMVVLAGFVVHAGDEVTSQSVSLVTGFEPIRSAEGELLPHHSLSGFIKRGMSFIQEQQTDWFTGDLLPDGRGGFYPPYFSYAKCEGTGVPYDTASGRAVYPAFHHSLFINMFLSHYRYSGDEESLQRACDLADWNLEHSTPATNVYACFPYSTYVQGESGGFVDGGAVMTDKPAIMALTYLRLYRTTLNSDYLTGAEKIAVTLSGNIQSDGHIPFRVIPDSGEISEDYTSSQIYAVELFDALDGMQGTNTYLSARNQVWEWLWNNPVSNMVWSGFYEDCGYRPDNRTNWDCIDTARYLLQNRSEHPEYEAAATNLFEWMQDTFSTTNHYYAPAEGFREQFLYFNIVGVHTMHWSMLLADLHKATGDENYKNRIYRIMNFMTYMQPSNNRIVVGPWIATYWYSCHMGALWFFIDQFGNYPEWAPVGETHLLKSAGEVRHVQYAMDSVSYETDRSGTEILRLAYPLGQVFVNGVPLEAGAVDYDAQTGVLRFSTPLAGSVFVQMTDRPRLEFSLKTSE